MKRVLLIRAEPPLVAALRTVFDTNVPEIEFCAGSAEAIRRVRERAIDVVVTDPETPIEEDVALAGELQRARPAVRVIVLSPEATQADVVEAIRAHVFACFTRPFDWAEIAAMVSSAITADTWRDGIEVVSGLPHWLTLRASCHLLTADRVVRFMTELQNSMPDRDRDLLIAAFREMLLNAMEHGGGFDPDKVIDVTAARTARAIVYHFRDPGGGFAPEAVEHAVAAPNPDTVLETTVRRAEMGLRPGGFGMLIVRQIVDEVVYNERGNEVILIKHLR